MRSITRHTGVITNIKRLPSSVNGNPRYSFQCDGYTIKTAVDSMYGYVLTNHEDREVTLTAGWHYGSLTLNTIESPWGEGAVAALLYAKKNSGR